MPPASPRATARSLALDTLLSIAHGQYGNIAVDTVLRRHPLSEADRHLFTALVYGVTERQVTLDDLLARFSNRPPEELDETVRTALRMGLYQLIYLDRVPDHAALDETVSLVPRRSSGYVNAVLRAYLRFENTLSENGKPAPRENQSTTPDAWCARFPDLGNDRLRALSVAYGIPRPLCERFVACFGESDAASLMAAFADKPPLTLRVNPLKTTAEAVRKALTDAGLNPESGLYLDTALRLSSGAIVDLPAFAEGDFMVQDEASQLCVRAMDARPGDLVIDTCACPGSKSFGLAMDMGNRGEIHAFDLHQSKLSLIESGARRLGIDIIRVAERDARTPDADLLGRADRVLCDVPCSGLGVIAKKPELRHKDLTLSDRLPSIQAAILDASAAYVRPGGVLVYSTCTLLPAENQEIVTRFLKTHPAFSPSDFAFPALTEQSAAIVSENGMVTLRPDHHRTDGFFIARLVRRA